MSDPSAEPQDVHAEALLFPRLQKLAELLSLLSQYVNVDGLMPAFEAAMKLKTALQNIKTKADVEAALDVAVETVKAFDALTDDALGDRVNAILVAILSNVTVRAIVVQFLAAKLGLAQALSADEAEKQEAEVTAQGFNLPLILSVAKLLWTVINALRG